MIPYDDENAVVSLSRTVDNIAFSIMLNFILSQKLVYNVDSFYFTSSGCHRIWYIQARMTDRTDPEEIKNAFIQYIEHINKAPGKFASFNLYDVDVFNAFDQTYLTFALYQ